MMKMMIQILVFCHLDQYYLTLENQFLIECFYLWDFLFHYYFDYDLCSQFLLLGQSHYRILLVHPQVQSLNIHKLLS
ncbi:unnamed protein product [Schistosoma mattheei]|uniref:Uncharacterized protein n=1 Tax=Schistosoma mattheei TaxID=31246 RepID=A0A183PCC5_9TREM|nr:unnamed protein product [Schistosoma mattheei]